jgi:hypothetical protein
MVISGEARGAGEGDIARPGFTIHGSVKGWRLRPIKDNSRDRGHGSKMTRTAVVGNEEGSKMKQNHKLPHGFGITGEIDTLIAFAVRKKPLSKRLILLHSRPGWEATPR